MKALIIYLVSCIIIITCNPGQTDILSGGANIFTNNEGKEQEVDPDSLTSCEFYQEFYSDGLLEEMSNNKNKEYEMAVGVYETYEEMLEEYLKTYLLIVCDFYDVEEDKMKVHAGSGNIYDIDDEYMYIITCVHISRDKITDELKKVTIRFVDDTLLEIEPNCFIIPNNEKDVALIKIPLSLISESTLSIVKTINISHAYTGSLQDFKNSTLYCYRFREHKYEQYYIYDMEFQNTTFNCQGDIAKGTSGGGFIDAQGNYYTLVLKGGNMAPSMLYYFNELLEDSKTT